MAPKTAILLLAGGLTLCGCAGDLRDAQESAAKAAVFVGDMQEATLAVIEQQRAVQQAEIARVAELQAASQINLAGSNQHRATWQAAGLKDSQELYKALVDMTADADLAKSAPFILMAPAPEFTAPAIDRKAFTNLIGKFNKLADGPSPIERATALAPFIKVVVKSYKDSAVIANRAKGQGPAATPVGTLMSLSSAPVSDGNKALSEEASNTDLSDNKIPVEGLLAVLGGS
jgi:hypothetical protein